MTEADQAALENRMQALGEHRGRTAISKALERGEAGETPAGVQLARRGIAPLAQAIAQFMADAYSGKGGRRHAAARLLVGVDPELAAYLTIKCARPGAKIAMMKKGGDRGNQHTGAKAPIGALATSQRQARSWWCPNWGTTSTTSRQTRRGSPALFQPSASWLLEPFPGRNCLVGKVERLTGRRRRRACDC